MFFTREQILRWARNDPIVNKMPEADRLKWAEHRAKASEHAEISHQMYMAAAARKVSRTVSTEDDRMAAVWHTHDRKKWTHGPGPS